MAEGEKTGLAAATQQAMAQYQPEPPPVQLPLMPADQLEALPTDDTRTRALRAPRRGRPPGAINRKTSDMAAWLLSRYISPLEALAEAYSRNVADLADELGCGKLEAFKLQIHAAAELAPYLHGKMPVAVEVGGALPVLHLVAPEAAALAFRRDADGRSVFDLSMLRPIEQNQPLSDASGGTVEQQKSNETPIAEENQTHGDVGPLIKDQQA